MSNVSALSFAGDIYFGLLDINKTLVSGFRKAGEVYPFSLQVTTAQKFKKSGMKATAGQSKHTITKIESIGGSATFHEMFAAVFAWALAGEEVELTGAGGTVSGEAITLIEGEWVRLANKGVDPATVVIGLGVLDTDFNVNGPLGLVRLIKTDVVTAGANTADYDHAAESGYQVKIGTKAQIRVALMLDGEDEFDGEAISGEWDSVVLASSAEINFISDPGTEYEELPFTLSFETLEGKSSPGRINGISI